jgi:hypothetical protein
MQRYLQLQQTFAYLQTGSIRSGEGSIIFRIFALAKLFLTDFISNCNDIEIKAKKQTLTLNVPYRVQSPFMPGFKAGDWKGSLKNVAERINQSPNLMYRFGKILGLYSEIIIEPDWFDYISINYEIIKRNEFENINNRNNRREFNTMER